MKQLNEQQVDNIAGGYVSTTPFFSEVAKTLDWFPKTTERLASTYTQSVLEYFTQK